MYRAHMEDIPLIMWEDRISQHTEWFDGLSAGTLSDYDFTEKMEKAVALERRTFQAYDDAKAEFLRNGMNVARYESSRKAERDAFVKKEEINKFYFFYKERGLLREHYLILKARPWLPYLELYAGRMRALKGELRRDVNLEVERSQKNLEEARRAFTKAQEAYDKAKAIEEAFDGVYKDFM